MLTKAEIAKVFELAQYWEIEGLVVNGGVEFEADDELPFGLRKFDDEYQVWFDNYVTCFDTFDDALNHFFHSGFSEGLN